MDTGRRWPPHPYPYMDSQSQFTFTLSVTRAKLGTLAKHRNLADGRFVCLQIFNELQHNLRLEGLEEVRLIKDKRTGSSKGFAFAQFARVPDAREFLDRYYPNLPLLGPYDSNKTGTKPANIRIAYGRERDERDKASKGEVDWKCDVVRLQLGCEGLC